MRVCGGGGGGGGGEGEEGGGISPKSTGNITLTHV